MPQLSRAFVKWSLFGFAALTLAAAAFPWARKGEVLDHRNARRLSLYYTLSRIDDPVIVLGDSLTEASTLPALVCGRPVVNAGLNGASTASDLGNWLSVALNGKRAASIIVALGTNDALVPNPESKEAFSARYGTLLDHLFRLSPRVAVIGIPSIQQQDRVTAEMARAFMQTVDSYNAVLPEIATRHGAAFVALDAFPNPGTIDGVHLNAAGYRAWEDAVLRAAAKICG